MCIGRIYTCIAIKNNSININRLNSNHRSYVNFAHVASVFSGSGFSGSGFFSGGAFHSGGAFDGSSSNVDSDRKGRCQGSSGRIGAICRRLSLHIQNGSNSVAYLSSLPSHRHQQILQG
jgi:hypothetical protein